MAVARRARAGEGQHGRPALPARMSRFQVVQGAIPRGKVAFLVMRFSSQKGDERIIGKQFVGLVQEWQRFVKFPGGQQLVANAPMNRQRVADREPAKRASPSSPLPGGPELRANGRTSAHIPSRG